MHVEIIRLRDHGWLLPRHRVAFVARVRANLIMSDVLDDTLNRSTRVARLQSIDTGQPIEDIPPLYDVQLVGVTRNVMTLSGVERLPDKVGVRHMDYAQTWLASPVADPERLD